MEHKNEILVIIDPQNDFMDSPQYSGSLAVKGAYNDMLRLAERIRNNPPSAIVVTLDTHSKMHIAHPIWWLNNEGLHPDPFTLITQEDVENGKWKAALPEMQEHSLSYVKKLKQQGNYDLRIWPFHCIENTKGHEVEYNLALSLQQWERQYNTKVTYVKKGMNPKTENYSVFKAEVIIPEDPETFLKLDLINEINSYKKVSYAGEASSHCVCGSFMDYINNIPESDINKTFLLKDCTSPVGGFEEASEIFFEKVVKIGANLEYARTKKLKI